MVTTCRVLAAAGLLTVASGLIVAQDNAASCASLPARPTAVLPAVIPVQIHNNHVLVPVCRGATRLTFTLDTGAPFSIFDLTLARQLGVEIESSYRANGGGPGTAAAARTREDAVIIPGALVTVPMWDPLESTCRHASLSIL